MSQKITCQICHEQVHIMQTHVESVHADHAINTIDLYQKEFPLAPIFSPIAQKKANEMTKARRAREDVSPDGKVSMRELFELPDIPAARAANGQSEVYCTVVSDLPDFLQKYVPEVDPNYVFNIDLLKSVLMAIELNMPIYLHGHSGVGKTTILSQVCARLRRPFLRVQHACDTEGAHIIGEKGVRPVDGVMETFFDEGPLPWAMRNGAVFCADEYDAIEPHVALNYQAVLEGEPLNLRESNQVIRPAEGFRFVATGNTNGSGDEHGIYSGTNTQNAANMERFSIVEYVDYMSPEAEQMLVRKLGISEKEASNLVSFATLCRNAFGRGDISLPISTRCVLTAAKLTLARGSFQRGLRMSYLNRLDKVSASVVEEFMDRYFPE